MAESIAGRRQAMISLQPFYNMKIGVVDLTAPSAAVVPLEADRISKHLGGASMNRSLLQEYGDALVFGTGPLTGSFAPASSLMVATFQSPLFERICHVPFMLRTGPEMKFSGIDFLVIRGVAPELSLLYVNNGSIRVVPAGNLRNLSVSDVVAALKRESLPAVSAIVTGPAADRKIPHAAASVGVTGSLDKAGLASRMAAKNLKGVVFAATGGLPFRKDHPDQGKALMQRISSGQHGKSGGFVSVVKSLEGGKEAVKPLSGLKTKHMACYHCPAPCMSYVTFARHEPSLLLLDHSGWIALFRKMGNHIFPVLQSCLQGGLDPGGVARTLPEGGSITEWLLHLEKMLPETGKDHPSTKYPDPPDVPVKHHTLFGGGIAPILPGDLWEKRVGIAMILGVCPVFLLRFPQIMDTDLLGFISREDVPLTNLHESLMSSINDIIADG
jgi:aldehyde:ferredoxin oxidoreductase